MKQKHNVVSSVEVPFLPRSTARGHQAHYWPSSARTSQPASRLHYPAVCSAPTTRAPELNLRLTASSDAAKVCARRRQAVRHKRDVSFVCMAEVSSPSTPTARARSTSTARAGSPSYTTSASGPGALRVDCQQPSSRAPSGTTSRAIDITLHHTLHHTIDEVDRVY